MDFFKKGNSKMLVIICPTTGATPIENLNAVCRVVEEKPRKLQPIVPKSEARTASSTKKGVE